MKKTISLLLAIILLLSFATTTNQQIARANAGQSTLLNTAKYALGLYLLAKIGEALTPNKSNNPTRIKEQNKDIAPNKSLANTIIVIDPGHGGFDPGATGPAGLLEKDINLEVALSLYDLLKSKTEAEVYLTRNTDVFVSLSKRTLFAREKNADIFLSIHHNGEKSGKQRGLETYAHYNSPRDSWALAWHIHESLAKQLDLPDNGLLAANFQVIRELTDRQAILLELGYLTNQADVLILQNPEIRNIAARAIYSGIINYYR